MFHYYQAFRDQFMAHYHKRSNVESTFSMVKAKFGGSIRSKLPVAQVNEVLAKFLCHNLCCLIQSSYELGIQATFWADQPLFVQDDILGSFWAKPSGHSAQKVGFAPIF